MIENGNLSNSDVKDSSAQKTETPDLEKNQNETTFNKLRKLQFLIKKESALKELCKLEIIFILKII